MITAGNGALGKSDISAISAEVKERLDQLAGLLNSQDASGEFLFSGFQGGTQPFQKNISGSFVYQGDQGKRFVQVEPNVTIATTQNGKEIFQNIDKSEPLLTIAIPTFNRPKLLKEALYSAVNQSRKTLYEIIIIDNSYQEEIIKNVDQLINS